MDCRSVAHLTPASEHGLSGECRVGAEPSPKPIRGRTEEGDEMDGWTDGRGEVPRDRARFGGSVRRFVGLEKYESSLE